MQHGWYRRRSDSGIIYRVFLQLRRGAARRGAEPAAATAMVASRCFRAHEMNSSLFSRANAAASSAEHLKYLKFSAARMPSVFSDPSEFPLSSTSRETSGRLVFCPRENARCSVKSAPSLRRSSESSRGRREIATECPESCNNFTISDAKNTGIRFQTVSPEGHRLRHGLCRSLSCRSLSTRVYCHPYSVATPRQTHLSVQDKLGLLGVQYTSPLYE